MSDVQSEVQDVDNPKPRVNPPVTLGSRQPLPEGLDNRGVCGRRPGPVKEVRSWSAQCDRRGRRETRELV